MTFLSLFFIFKIRHHTNNLLESFKMVDCSYHRTLEYLHKGYPMHSWAYKKNNTKAFPVTSNLLGWYGLDGFSYVLSELSANYHNIEPITEDKSFISSNI